MDEMMEAMGYKRVEEVEAQLEYAEEVVEEGSLIDLMVQFPDVPAEALASLPEGYRIVTEETYNPNAPFMECKDGRDGWFYPEFEPDWEDGFYAQAVGDVKP